MRNSLLLGFILIISIQPVRSYAQLTPDTIKYQQAYQFILSSKEFRKWRQPCVIVFDSIVSQEQVVFAEALGSARRYVGTYRETRLIDSLTALDATARHAPCYSSLTAELTKNHTVKKGCSVILFSRLQHDILMAEVSANYAGGNTLRSILPVFNQTLRYLLIYDFNGKIKKYYTRKISYN